MSVEGDSTIDAERRLHHLTIPTNGNSNVGGNLLDVPSVGRHFRSQSTSSFGSRDSGWTPSPGQMTPASDIGDPEIDVRGLMDLDQEDQSKHSPFAFSVKQLIKLHDPKDLNVLRAMGGLEGLCLGLRTDVNVGLSWDEEMIDGHITLEDVRQRLEMQRNEAESSLQGGRSSSHPDSSTDQAPDSPTLNRSFTRSSISFRHEKRSFEARRKVFGENKIPMRSAKNIFRLMWEVGQDKVLVPFL